MIRLKALATGALVALLIATTVVDVAPAASLSDQQLVETRVAAMKQNGKILRGAKTLTGQAAVDAAATILKNFTAFPSLFRQGSITPDSRALPAIWENWADFTGRLAKEKANAAAMVAAAKAGDKTAYVAAIEALKKPCSNCHVDYARIF